MMNFDPLNHLLELYETDPGNRFDDPSMGPLFDPPLVGVAAADDPWFARFKEIIGDFHWTPQEALELVTPQTRARSVISWCLPVAEAARVSNRRETQFPSRNWAYVRTFGEEFVTRLRHGMERRLRALGFAAVAPAVVPECDVKVRAPVGLSSRWSERHVAFAAGLGTFGLSGGLITHRGIAHRLGSVVTSADIPPTPRPYGDHAFAWCLKLSGGTCGACIRRCPVGSIGETIQDRDKSRCHEHAYILINRRGREVFGWEGVYGCGLCQTAVPCEGRNPTESSGPIRS
jgi:epoxyqueuosine reductase QueG